METLLLPVQETSSENDTLLEAAQGETKVFRSMYVVAIYLEQMRMD